MKIRTWPLTLSLLKEHRFLCGIFCWILLVLPVAAQMGGMGRRGWGGGNFASTAQQGADYGMASMMKAQGYQNLQNSEAAKNLQSAQSMQIDNRKKWTETYFDMRRRTDKLVLMRHPRGFHTKMRFVLRNQWHLLVLAQPNLTRLPVTFNTLLFFRTAFSLPIVQNLTRFLQAVLHLGVAFSSKIFKPFARRSPNSWRSSKNT